MIKFTLLIAIAFEDEGNDFEGFLEKEVQMPVIPRASEVIELGDTSCVVDQVYHNILGSVEVTCDCEEDDIALLTYIAREQGWKYRSALTGGQRQAEDEQNFRKAVASVKNKKPEA